MVSLLTNNPTMVAIIVVVVLIAVLLHLGVYFFIRRVMRAPPLKSSDDL